jgi:adenosylmethionine-8-amino-7-oxononanoate aminotransferase
MIDLEFDQQHLWHPFTQALKAQAPLGIVKAQGAYLFDGEQTPYLDLISSWWVTCHGHAHPKIARKIYEQAKVLEQVIFAGFTHPPAIQLCKNLLKHLPAPLSRFFFSDNGSTAVEVALKMAYQYFYNQDQKQKKIFLHFKGGYHGDTFGAMAVGKSSSFYKPFEPFLFETLCVPFPDTYDEDPDVELKEQKALELLEGYLDRYRGQICSFIMEVGVQGASGMKMARPSFYQTVCSRVQQEGILLIFDEVMTGFYRTGALFSFLNLKITPDFLCLSKGLSGGFLPLALTITSEKVYQAFVSEDETHTFLHGHSFTANPLGCAAALASLELFEDPKVVIKLKKIEQEHRKGLAELKKTGLIQKMAVLGTIARFELKKKADLGALRQSAQKHGLIIRPLKGVIYLMPPYIISLNDLRRSYKILKQIIVSRDLLS